jgi:hypothetical protein
MAMHKTKVRYGVDSDRYQTRDLTVTARPAERPREDKEPPDVRASRRRAEAQQCLVRAARCTDDDERNKHLKLFAALSENADLLDEHPLKGERKDDDDGEATGQAYADALGGEGVFGLL